MLAGGKKKTSSSFGPDGRRIGGGGLGAGGGPRRVIKTVGKRGAGLANPAMLKSSPAGAAAAAAGGSGITTISDCAPSKTCFGRGGGGLGLTSRGPHATNKLFQPGVKLKIQRAPMMTGLSVGAGVRKPFQRPQLGRRAYDKNSEAALKRATLGQKRRMDGMSKLLARAGKGLNYKTPGRAKSGDGDDGSDASCADEEEEEDSLMAQLERNYKPLMVWQSPHNGGEAKGLPKALRTVTRPDEYGVEEEVTIKTGPPAEAYTKEDQYVPKVLAKWLRPHQREGVKFMYECVMGMRDFDGNGCILADGKWRARIYLFGGAYPCHLVPSHNSHLSLCGHARNWILFSLFISVVNLSCNVSTPYNARPTDMGLGKTLQSVTLIWTLLKTGIAARPAPTAKRIIVVCPCSLVKNWDNEFVKWLGPGTVKTIALAESDRKTVEKNLDVFVKTKMFNVLIASYETMRTHIGRLNKHKDCCDLLGEFQTFVRMY